MKLAPILVTYTDICSPYKYSLLCSIPAIVKSERTNCSYSYSYQALFEKKKTFLFLQKKRNPVLMLATVIYICRVEIRHVATYMPCTARVAFQHGTMFYV